MPCLSAPANGSRSGPDGWANYGYARMPDYRWGIFLTPPEADRRINFGIHKGEPAWQELPGDYRAGLRSPLRNNRS